MGQGLLAVFANFRPWFLKSSSRVVVDSGFKVFKIQCCRQDYVRVVNL